MTVVAQLLGIKLHLDGLALARLECHASETLQLDGADLLVICGW